MTAPHDSSRPQWSAETRTWVSLLLFVHLFALFVAVTTYTRPSGLERRLHELFDPYLRNLHLTAYPVSYPFARYHLTHSTTSDVNFSIEVDVPRADGATETVTLPRPMSPAIRMRRYQALANAAGTLAASDGNDAYAGILPKVIAGSILKRDEAADGTIRVRAHGLPGLDLFGDLASVASPIRQAADKNVENVYEAQAIVAGGAVELLRKSTTLETAPAENPARRGNGPSGAAGQRNPQAKASSQP